MKNSKKAFVLFFTLILLLLFSFTAVKFYETQTISSTNLIKQYNYIQAKNHIKFLEEYILSLESLDTVDKIKIQNSKFEIYATIKKENISYRVEMYVENKNSNIRIYKKIEV